jgi:hypothetical protein
LVCSLAHAAKWMYFSTTALYASNLSAHIQD